MKKLLIIFLLISPTALAHPALDYHRRYCPSTWQRAINSQKNYGNFTNFLNGLSEIAKPLQQTAQQIQIRNQQEQINSLQSQVNQIRN